MNTYIIIAAAAAVIIAVVITWLIMRAHEVKACNELENKLIGAQKDLENAQKRCSRSLSHSSSMP